MSAFLHKDLRVCTSDGRNVTLIDPLAFQRPDTVGGQIITMPAGSTSDGASIPQELWSTGLAPFGKWWLACVLHDGAYRGVTVPRIDSRELADLILWEAMLSLEVPESVARLIYEGVRLGGEHAWAKDRSENREQTPNSEQGRRHDVAG